MCTRRTRSLMAGSLSITAVPARAIASSSNKHRFISLFRVQVLLHLRLAHRRANAIPGHVQLADPQERVEHDLAKVRVAPIDMKMTAGKADAAAAVLALHGPHHRLGSSLRRLNVLVRSTRIDVRPVANRIAGLG